jgi:asparagine synthase (glutamine-hydrolysing)
MCGIAGIACLDGFEAQTLVAMTHLISYRGPSGFGFAYDGIDADSRLEIIHNEDRHPYSRKPVIGLGNRRLAILDVSAAGSQPMAIENGECCITFNGEIYNYREIRSELERYGHRFRTGTDTEVILRSYQEWGEKCLDRFNGMWSFALWDRRNHKLFCARDRFGVKPFYYATIGGGFYFGSEIKQILAASGIVRRANSRCVHHFLEWGLVDFSSETFFENIYQLQGGHLLRLEVVDSLKLKIERYWELRISPRVEATPEDATHEFRSRFRRAVRLRLRSDVPVGVCLSGGLDSSAVLCQAKELSPGAEFQTFSACFDEPSVDEREYMSAAVTAACATPHRVFPSSERFWEAIGRITYHQDEPLISTGPFPEWCVMEEARNRNTPVILGGQGGDETLCGYRKYRYFHLWHLLRSGDPAFLRELALSPSNGTRFYWVTGAAAKYLPGPMRRPFSLFERVCTPEFREQYRRAKAPLGAASSIAERQRIDLTFSSLPALLHLGDRMSMAHSIESRLPFLDYQLVEFTVNCPPALKLRDGWSKWLLRNSMRGTLPEKIRLRKTKLGFDTPDEQWVRMGLQDGPRRLWQSPRLRMERFLRSSSLESECRKFLRKDALALSSDLIFRALSLELWAQVYSVC